MEVFWGDGMFNIYLLGIMIIMGAIFGSFYAVVGDRLSKGESIIKPRSHCTYCQHNLTWYELIPIVSFLILKGKCRHCHAKLSWWYLIVEILSASLFGLSYYLYGFSYELIIALIISSLLIIIYVSDFKYMIINDEPLIIAIALVILTKFCFFGLMPGLKAIISGLLLFSFMLLVKLCGDKIFKRESLGGGDIKLAFFIGCTLNIQLALVSLVLSSFLALPYASYYVFKKQEKEIPFGPFLITGVFITFVFQKAIIAFLELLFMVG